MKHVNKIASTKINAQKKMRVKREDERKSVDFLASREGEFQNS